MLFVNLLWFFSSKLLASHILISSLNPIGFGKCHLKSKGSLIHEKKKLLEEL